MAQNPQPDVLQEAIRRIETALASGASALDLSDINLYRLPNELSLLAEQLITLKLNGNRALTSLASIENLTQLTQLDMRRCEALTSLAGIEGLTQLTQLKMSGCYALTSLAGIENLTQLTKLEVRWCKALTSLAGIENLTQLTKLHMSGCEALISLTGIENLTQLTLLNMNGCPLLTDFTDLLNLKQLLRLNLSSCKKLKGLDKLSELSQLEFLTLFAMNISDIGFLSRLQQLTYLRLDGNSIKDVEPLAKLLKLSHVDLENNQIEDVSQLSQLSQLPHLDSLLLCGNPFAKHYDLKLTEGKDSLDVINNLTFRLDNVDNEIISLPTKVLFLGNHAAGKSSLVNYFKKNTLNNISDSTHILQISPYDLEHKPLPGKKRSAIAKLPSALFYDFGGQDYYHGIYRVFMSQQAITCLLWHPNSNNNRVALDSTEVHNRHFSRDYWLGYWRHYNQDQKLVTNNQRIDSPLLLIQSHADKNANRQAVACTEAYNQHLVSLNHEVDGSPENALQILSLQYLQAQLDSLISVKQKQISAAFWYAKFLKNILKKHQKSVKTSWQAEPIYDWVKYYNPMNKDEDLRLEHLKTELGQLHAQGLVLYYPKVNPDKVWLNPMAFADHVHTKVLHRQTIERFKGMVPSAQFEKFDKDIITLLEQEKVIFKHRYGPEGDEYLIPNYLPLALEEAAEYRLITFGLQGSLAFSLWFKDYLPVGLINQLVCHFGNFPDYKKFWRDQLLFTLEADSKYPSQVLIKLIFEETLQIKVYISNASVTQYNKHIAYVYYVIISLFNDGAPEQHISNFEKYLTDFQRRKKVDIDEQPNKGDRDGIAITQEFRQIYLTPPSDLWISVNNEHFIQASQLTQLTKETQLPSIALSNEQQSPKLTSVTPFSPFTHKNLNKMLKVFISYSHDDIAARRELQQYLINLDRDGIIEIWQDGMINTGDDWHQSITTALDQADIVIMLVSQSFIASSYVHNVEMPQAMALKDSGRAKIFPILLSNCDFQHWHVIPDKVRQQLPNNKDQASDNYSIGDYQFFPMDEANQRLKPINRWGYPEDAWTQVTQRLREISKA